MRIKNIGPKVSGAPLPGKVGEVDDGLGALLLARGHAIRVDRLSNRLGTGVESEERWAPGTGVDMHGVGVAVGEFATVGDDGEGSALDPFDEAFVDAVIEDMAEDS